jgi:flagellar basal-body rod modification protein FlgD
MSTLSSISSASDLQMDYMKLLITQLQNQNPLEPLDNNEMASQLAQFSELQQLETMNSSFAKVLTSTERNYAASLLGKEVAFAAETEEGTVDTQKGTVEQVYYNNNGEIWLTVGDYAVRLEDVITVKN